MSYRMSYRIIDSLFEEKNTKILTKEEIMNQFSYLNIATFDELIRELESIGYKVYPIVD